MTKRFNLALPDKEMEIIEQMADEMGVSVTHLLRTFARLAHALYNESKMGGKLIVRRSNGTDVEILWGV